MLLLFRTKVEFGHGKQTRLSLKVPKPGRFCHTVTVTMYHLAFSETYMRILKLYYAKLPAK